jgi:ribosomal protein S8
MGLAKIRGSGTLMSEKTEIFPTSNAKSILKRKMQEKGFIEEPKKQNKNARKTKKIPKANSINLYKFP